MVQTVYPLYFSVGHLFLIKAKKTKFIFLVEPDRPNHLGFRVFIIEKNEYAPSTCQ